MTEGRCVNGRQPGRKMLEIKMVMSSLVVHRLTFGLSVQLSCVVMPSAEFSST